MRFPPQIPRLCAAALLAAGGAVNAAETGDPADADWTVHAQTTYIDQAHPGFSAAYSGENSLDHDAENSHTLTATIFLGRALWPGAALYFDPEVTQGNGLSGAVGVAGFPNGEATRAGSQEPVLNIARLYFSQTFGFGSEKEKLDSDQNQLAGDVDVDRLTLKVGKLSAVDDFDDNDYSHDPRNQFLNWALMDSGAWDYPADTKGYTAGFSAVLNQKTWALRYGIFMEPTEANGPRLDPHIDRAFGQILQWDGRYTSNGHPGIVRPFVFFNRADMGSYTQALQEAPVDPNITTTRQYRSKYGAGVSWNQELTGSLGAFARLSWDDGRTETWAFTEIDSSAAAGLSDKGGAWGRSEDVVGLAVLANGLSSEHREYLAAGGYGFIVGDGRLNYAPEHILESYYNFKVGRGLSLMPDFQYVTNPGYNRDRGPVPIYAVRAHFEF